MTESNGAAEMAAPFSMSSTGLQPRVMLSGAKHLGSGKTGS
jgi:hypothetical protein